MTLDSGKINRLWEYLKPYWFLELIAFLVMAVMAGFTLALPGAVRYLIDDLIPGLLAQPKETVSFTPVVWFGLFLIGIYLGQVVFSWLRDYLAAFIGANIIANMRSRLFAHMERLSLSFYQSHQVGELMSRFLNDINRIQNLLTSTLLMFLTNLLMLLGILIYLLTIDWKMTLTALVPVPLTVLVTRHYGVKLNHINRRLMETLGIFSARLQESFLGIKTIKAFGREKEEELKVGQVMNELTGIYIKYSVTTSLSAYLSIFFNMLGPIVVLAWGTYLIVMGQMQLGALMAFYMLLAFLYSPVQGLASVHLEVQAAMASVDRIFEYFDLPPAVAEDPHPVRLEKVRGEIQLKNISFKYEQGAFAISDFNLVIKPGEKVAVVGPSGSGKTTLINLIMRFYDPPDGMIMLDGVDLRRLSLASLRASMALVDQDPLLFKTSVFQNIAYANPDAKPEAVKKAADIANIHDYIMSLPQGYDTEVGERGVTVSGGEKQRLCLARAILKNTPILILDEATSALDANSEKLIQESLKNILDGKTAIIIAHRLSTVQHADRIIVMEAGRIVGEGTHDMLLAQSPLYRELAQKQLLV